MTDQDDTGDGGQSNGGGLRKQLEQTLERLKVLETENSALKTQTRQTAVSALLTEKKYNPKVAKLIPDSVQPTAEAVQAWLDEYGDVFNIAKDESSGSSDGSSGTGASASDEDSEAAMEYIQTMRQMGNVNGGLLPPERARELMAKLSSPDLTQDGLIALINQHGGGSGMG